MKTAVSIPDPIFAAADDLAARRGMNRSQLYTQALRELLGDEGADPVTLALDALADDLEPTRGSNAGRALIEAGDWEW